jgi:hypothetical protein
MLTKSAAREWRGGAGVRLDKLDNRTTYEGMSKSGKSVRIWSSCKFARLTPFAGFQTLSY